MKTKDIRSLALSCATAAALVFGAFLWLGGDSETGGGSRAGSVRERADEMTVEGRGPGKSSRSKGGRWEGWGKLASDPSEEEDSTLHVAVIDEADQPIAGALVCAPPSLEGEALSGCAPTDGSGIVTLPGNRATELGLTASAPGFLPSESYIEQAAGLIFILKKGASSLLGVVEDAGGGPVAGALVTVKNEGDSLVASAFSGPDGQFALSAADGPATLQVTADGYGGLMRGVVLPTSRVRLKLVPGSSIEGVVTASPSGRPLEGVLVQARNHSAEALSFGTATTSSEGRFSIRNLGSGSHFVSVHSPDFSAHTQEIWLGVGEHARVDFSARAAGTLQLTLLVDGAPCEEGSARLGGPSPLSGAVEEGGIVRISGLEPGDYEVMPLCEEARQASPRRVSITAGDVVSQTWELDSGLAVAGQVTGGPSQDVSGLSVRVVEREGGTSRRCVTDHEGGFSCPGLVPGTYTCAVTHQGVSLSETVEISVREPGPEPLSIALVPTGGVLVRVVSDEGSQLDNVRLELKPFTGAPLAGQSKGNGETEFDRLPAGSYILRLEGAGEGEEVRSVQITAGRTQVVEWVFRPRDVEGRIADAEGFPLPDTWVAVWGPNAGPPAPPDAISMTDSEGYFRLRGLVRPVYVVQLDGPSGTQLFDALQVQELTSLRMDRSVDRASGPELTSNASDRGIVPARGADSSDGPGEVGSPSPGSSAPPGSGTQNDSEGGGAPPPAPPT